MSSFPIVRRRMKKAFFCLFLALVGLCEPVQAQAATGENVVYETRGKLEEIAPTDSVVLFGFTGVRWEDINEKDTPNLFAFTHKASGANLVVKTFGETTCPTRGWLTLGAGVRMNASCTPAEIDADGRVVNWDSYVSANVKNQYKPHIGLLGTSLEKSVGSEKILVLGSGAGLALADSTGKVAGEYIDTIRVGDTSELNGRRVSVVEGLANIDAETRLVFVDLGQVRYGDSRADEETREGINSVKAAFISQNANLPEEAQRDLSAIDKSFGQALKRVKADMPHARILVASLADSQSSRSELSFFAAQGLSTDEGSFLLTSDATRSKGFIQNADMTATLIAWFCSGAQQSSISGSPLSLSASTDTLTETLVSEQNRARLSRGLVGIFYFFFGMLTIITAFLAWRALRREPESGNGGGKSRNYLAFIALAVASLPVSALLANCVPWWQFSYPRLVFAAITLCIVLLIAGVAYVPLLRGVPQVSLAIIGFVTAGVIAVDAVIGSITHSCLQFPSVFGAPAQVGGRFYGLSNATFGIFATGLLIGLAIFGSELGKRGKSAQGVALIIVFGLVALSIDGLAILGADFGGPPALTLGLAFLAFTIRGKKITVPRAAIIVFLAVCTSLVFSLIDYAQPASERSHLGRFIQSVKDGNLLSVLSRKISAAVFGIPAPLALVLMLAFVLALVWVWKKYKPSQALHARLAPPSSLQGDDADVDMFRVIRYSLPALVLTLVSAAFINDSSITIPILGGAMAIMLYTSVLLQAR